MKFIVFCFIAVSLIGCATVPITGRRQLSIVPNSQLIALSRDSYKKLLKDSKISSDREKVRMVIEVGNAVSRSAEQFMAENGMEEDIKEYDWEFNLIDDDEIVNAFCMAGGKVGIYTGMLRVAQDENGLATVLGHEIAHAIANHSGERMSQVLLAQLGGASLARAVREKPDRTRQLVMLAYGMTANVGVLLPYSRTHETEADCIGLVMMARAGYDPREAISFWQRMREEEKIRPPEFLSTHPAPNKRMEYIRSEIPNAMQYYRLWGRW